MEGKENIDYVDLIGEYLGPSTLNVMNCSWNQDDSNDNDNNDDNDDSSVCTCKMSDFARECFNTLDMELSELYGPFGLGHRSLNLDAR